MVAYAYILLGIVCMICFVISPNLDDCTNLTKTCPAVVQWPERGNLYMCPGKRSYVCLMSEENTLREGCIFNFPIPAGTTGCPYTKHCDTLTGQPVLVTPNNYRSCSPDLDGCPSRNHPGYSILDIHKYPLCQGRDTSDERRVAPGATTNSPKRASKHENWTIIGICLGTSFPLLIAVIFFVRKKMNHSPEVLDVSCKDDQIASTKLLDCKSGAQKDLPLPHKLHIRVDNGNNEGSQNPMQSPQSCEIQNRFQLGPSKYFDQQDNIWNEKKNMLLPKELKNTANKLYRVGNDLRIKNMKLEEFRRRMQKMVHGEAIPI